MNDLTESRDRGGYQKLRAWQSAAERATECYLRTAAFPSTERFGLTSQMRRAAISVVSNIAEGHGRDGPAAFANFLSIARGSVKELEAQTIMAVRLGFASPDEMQKLQSLCNATSRLVYALRRSLRRGSTAPNSLPETPDSSP